MTLMNDFRISFPAAGRYPLRTVGLSAVHTLRNKLPAVLEFGESVAAAGRTLFLFTASDIKTIVIPITTFALTSANKTSFTQAFHTILWIWMQLLQFCVSNQSLSVPEDTANKPWRPIPAGRITVPQARVLRWILVPVCLIACSAYGVTAAGVLVVLNALLMNEADLTSHWFLRNVFNASAYSTLDFGACIVAELDDSSSMARRYAAAAIGALIILTTVHAQDFQDVEGDKIAGRLTIPMILPRAGRPMLALSLLAWSIALSVLCNLSTMIAMILNSAALIVGLRFILLRKASDDRTSYALYNVWLALARILPSIALRA